MAVKAEIERRYCVFEVESAIRIIWPRVEANGDQARGAVIVSEDDFYNHGLPEKVAKILLVDGPYGTDGKEALPYFASVAESTPGSKHT